MKVDFTIQIPDMEGKPIPSRDEEGRPVPDKFVTLGDITSMAVLSPYADEQNLGAAEKVKRYRLASFTYEKHQPVEMSIDDVAEASAFGLSAEEVAEKAAEFATFDEDGLPFGVQYGSMVASLIGLVKDQRSRIAALEARLH